MSTSSLRALGARFAYTDAVPLFEDGTFTLSPGWTGLVGPNGAGKTTLLRLLAGELPPSSGRIERLPPEGLVLLCEQRVEVPSPQVEAFSEAWDAGSGRLRAELGLDPVALWRWDTLSPGERKRWQIAAALAARPEVLLLDEPQNHLDAEARRWLLDALGRFRGVGVVVSHDRALLDALTTRTLRLDHARLTLWTGGYSAARAQWEAARAGEKSAFQAAKEAQARTLRLLDEKRRALEGAVRERSTGRRMKDKYDSDARGLMADFKVAQAEKRIGRQVAVLRRAAERASGSVADFQFEKELGGKVFAGYAPCPRPALLQWQTDALRAGERQLLGPTQLVLRREDRVHLAGVNGAGKTTLLRALLGACSVPPEQLLVLPQDTTRDDARAALEALHALSAEVRGRVLSLVAALGADPERLLRTSDPSPGEIRKLLIAEGLGRHVWALVLDEPTNHLDLPSIERLEAALAQWPGALLLVTHDEAFAASARCTTRWSLGDGLLTVSSVDPG